MCYKILLNIISSAWTYAGVGRELDRMEYNELFSFLVRSEVFDYRRLKIVYLSNKFILSLSIVQFITWSFEKPDMSVEKSKKAIGRGNRAFVTKVIQTAENAIAKFGGTQTEKDILEGYKVTLLDKKESIKKLDEDILNEIQDEEKITEDIFQAGEVGESINRMIIKIDNVLKAVAMSSVTSQEGLGADVSNGTQHIYPQPAKAKLPKVSLKKFTGNPTDWQSFYDSYTAAVHNNHTLSKVDKFNYLKALLEGPAAAATAGFTLTEENYETALKLLKDRYANPQVIVSSHDALLKLESCSNIHEISKMRNLYESIETHIRSLANLEVPSESYGTILIPMILAKLPQEMQLLISRKVGKDNWKLDDLLREFRVELEAWEGAPCYTALQRKKTVYKRDMSHIHHLPYLLQVILTQYRNVLTVGNYICHQNVIL